MILDKKYRANEVEKKWEQYWEENNLYKFDKEKPGKIYSVDTPPPTVSGSLHIGHIFSYTHTDLQVRYFRMKGYNIFYPMGFDDNGLPSEILTEKDQKIRATDLPRKEFIDRCYTTCKKYEKLYENLWRRIALSVDWSEIYTTIEERMRRISQRSFIELLKKGRIYFKEGPVMWCPKCKTAIAQAEIEEKVFESHFDNLIFKLSDGSPLIIATTRCELLSSCVAVFVNPKDKRYSHLEGCSATVPVFNHIVPILKDEAVDMEKGTGVVMCCTFGDRQDIEWWKKHSLPLRISVTENGKMNKLAEDFKHLKVEHAREMIYKRADELGLVECRKNITHEVNTHERCGTPLEFLSKKQWFLKVMDLKEVLIARADEINWYPDFMKKRYIDWVKNLAWDWCLSRQRFYGVPIPVWHCIKCGNFILPEYINLPVDPLNDPPPIEECPECSSKDIRPETDILDTWATSSMTPDINLKYWEKDQRDCLYPMSLRPQAHEIIRTWTFYTIVKSHLHHDSIPWENVVISGFVTIPSSDPGKINIKSGKKVFKAEKISKSKHGEMASPMKLLDKYSADILRYWSANASLGYDMQFRGVEEIEIGKRVITKIWNSFRFISMFLEDYKPGQDIKLETIDRYLLISLNQVIKKTTEYFDNYDFRLARNTIVDFFWKIFCDNYLEIIKDRLYNTEKRSEDEKISALYTLYITGRTLLGLLAPFLPYITEELYQNLYREQEESVSIHLTKWPGKLDVKTDERVMRAGDMFVEFLMSVREYKGNKGLSQKAEIERAVIYSTEEDREVFSKVEIDFLSTTHILDLSFSELKGEDQYHIEII